MIFSNRETTRVAAQSEEASAIPRTQFQILGSRQHGDMPFEKRKPKPGDRETGVTHRKWSQQSPTTEQAPED